MLCDGRIVCGCADPVRQSRARRRAHRRRRRRSGPARPRRSCARDLNAGGSSFCGDCPLKLPLQRDEPPPQRDRRCRAASARLYIECTAACNISCIAGVLRAGDRHHQHAAGRHARLRPVHARVDEAGPSLGAHRLLQLRRSVPAQARGRDVRVHQDALPAHLSLHQHQRPGASPRTRRGGWCAPASTR